MIGPNNHPPVVTPSSSNRKYPLTSGTRIDHIATQMEHVLQRLSKQSSQFSYIGHQANLDKPMTYKEVANMLTKTRMKGDSGKRG